MSISYIPIHHYKNLVHQNYISEWGSKYAYIFPSSPYGQFRCAWNLKDCENKGQKDMKFKFLGCFLVIDVQLQEYCCNCYPYNIYVITVNSASNLYMSVSSFPPIFCTFID